MCGIVCSPSMPRNPRRQYEQKCARITNPARKTIINPIIGNSYLRGCLATNLLGQGEGRRTLSFPGQLHIVGSVLDLNHLARQAAWRRCDRSGCFSNQLMNFDERNGFRHAAKRQTTANIRGAHSSSPLAASCVRHRGGHALGTQTAAFLRMFEPAYAASAPAALRHAAQSAWV